jgi:hypothetical protein
MNYYTVRELADENGKALGKFHYTRNGIATGYCRDGGCDHNSEEEALECWKKYLLDNHVSYDHTMYNQMCKCRVCGEWTDKFAQVGSMDMYVLCDNHRNREELEKLVRVGQAWSSD